MTLPLNFARVVGIAADDVTGATDSVVQFSRSGWDSRLLLDTRRPRRFDAGCAVALTSDARPMNPASAQAATAQTVQNLLSMGADHLYLKIDSTMRGSVAGQLEGALSAWKVHHPGCFAVVCPSYPAMGRTVENGRIRVNGKLVEDSPAGLDPVTPVTTSDLSALLPGTRSITLLDASARDNARLLQEAAGTGAVTVNAATDADLRVLAEALAAAGPAAIPAGSAGLARAMAETWAAAHPGLPPAEVPLAAPAQRIVVVVSSVHDVTRAQTAYLRSLLDPNELLILQPDASLLHSPKALDEWAAEQLAQASAQRRVVLILSPELGSGLSLSGAAIARRLATVVRHAVENDAATALVLVGGDGAQAVLNTLGAQALRITGAVQEGIPRGLIEGGTATGRVVATKAGGFGEISALLDTVNDLTNYIVLPSETH